ncbi:hypothetical protein MML48_4g00015184 [Holotrichia oblita]|uniref:Uncharacterized protein n=3 Tax=Holotrichia oblita TaxID=644536 RepID=A0ACB9T6I0_HOLOL|nr:hypothetical protein MML48_4g00008376 [Holotrichia oblita]KAI4462401.1 hypothetical protein MML48_4g00015184 [Holotrichia oblita]
MKSSLVNFLCVILLASGANCCEISSFSNVSVTVVGVLGIDKVSGCLEPIGLLEKVSFVQIINQSVPVLYRGAVKDLPNLADLILENSGVSSLEPGAFRNLTRLRLLRLQDNKIQEIKEGVFNGLPVSEISLKNNNISHIDAQAFDNLTKLQIISLDKNRLTTWDSNWFMHCSEIKELSFKHNFIRNIPERAFRNIRGVHHVNGKTIFTNIHLDNNEIENIDPNALLGLRNLGWLILSRNNLKQIPETLLDPIEQIDWLKLNFNMLTCVPDKVLNKVPNLNNYLEGNPLDDNCKELLSRL